MPQLLFCHETLNILSEYHLAKNEAFFDNHPIVCVCFLGKKAEKRNAAEREKKTCFQNCSSFLFFHHFCEKIECQEIVLDEILLKEQKNSLSPNERKVFFLP